VSEVVNGGNGTIFAYGQTGSGKTYTMMGKDLYSPASSGITPRAGKMIFDMLKASGKGFYLTISVLEIYKENILDLLRDAPTAAPSLQIKE
jgi:kinesin family protein 5